MQQHTTPNGASHSAQRYQRPRSGPRARVNKRAVITMPRSGKPHPVLLVDISLAGACIQSDIDLRLGDEILMRAELGPGLRFAASALVVGARGKSQTLYGQYGLRLLKMDDEAEAALKRFVATPKKAG